MRKKTGGGSWARNRRGHAGVGYFGGGARRASDEDTTQGAERRCTDDSERWRQAGELRATDGCSSPSRQWAGEDGHNILGGYFFGVVNEIMDFCKGVVASLAT